MDTPDRSFNCASRFQSEWAGDVAIPTNVEWVDASDDLPCRFVAFKNRTHIPAKFWMAGKIANRGNCLSILGDWTPSSASSWMSARWVLRLIEPDEDGLREEFRGCIRVMDALQSQATELYDVDHANSTFSNTVASPCAVLSAPMYRLNPARLQILESLHASQLSWSRFSLTNDILPLNLITDTTWTIQPPQYAHLLPGLLVETHFSLFFYPGEQPRFVTRIDDIYLL